MAQHTPKVPMQDDEIKVHKPVCAELASFRAGIRCAERVYQVEDLVRQVNHWTDEWSDVRDENQSLRNKLATLEAQVEQAAKPIDMVLHCPACGVQHVDAPSPTDGQNLRMWSNPPHKSHLCRPEDGGCGHIWRPADVPTNGVAAIKTKGKADSRQPAVTRPQPVGYATERDISLMADGGRGALVWAKALENDSIPLYTSPPKAAPLTDEQKNAMWVCVRRSLGGGMPEDYYVQGISDAEHEHGITSATAEKGSRDAN